MKKEKKHPKDMTNDELLKHIFHPDVVKHIKKHVEEIKTKKKGRLRKSNEPSLGRLIAWKESRVK